VKISKIIIYFLAVSLLFASLWGCSKKEDSPTVEDETTSESAIQETEMESSAQTISPLMEQFLGKTVKTRKATAGYQISEFFYFWQDLLHNPRISMEIYFDVELEAKFQRDHIWKNKTSREILDELCQEYNLIWTITEPNTIRIDKRRN
jgi:hypothetical protein